MEIIETLASQEMFDKRVQDLGGLSATTLDLIQEILKLDPEKYTDQELVQLISQAIKLHFDYKEPAE